MKKIIVGALLAAFAVSPSFADDAKAPVKKTAEASPDAYVHMHQGCDAAHGGHHEMMEGYGMTGAGMPAYKMLSLSADQRARINKLSDALDQDNWTRQGMINDESAKLRDLYGADKRDPTAIGAEYSKIFDLKRQIIEAYLNTQNQIEDILTPEQRAQMKEFHKHHMHYMQ